MNKILGFLFFPFFCVLIHTFSADLQAAPVEIQLADELHEIPTLFTGINTSYYNDLDYVWALGDVEQYLRNMRIGVLRWPGGAETSFYNWEHPGVDGYIDYYNPNTHRFDWQTVRVGPENWDENTLFVELDQFIERSLRVGAEPLIGVNMSTGELMDRREEGIASAVRMIEHILEKGYPVRYIYMDNEPWHPGGYLQFSQELHTEVYIAYASAIREVAPELKLIASPTNQPRLHDANRDFLKQAAPYVDYMNLHFYWEWGTASTERWKRGPMRNSSQWTAYEDSRPFNQQLQVYQRQLNEAGWDHIGLVVLEWNIGPIERTYEGSAMNDHILAMAQAEMLLQLAKGEIHMSVMWPLFWQALVPGFAEDLSPPESTGRFKGPFRGPFEVFPPYETRTTYTMFHMLRDLPGSTLINVSSANPSIVASAASSPTGATQIYLHNKSDETQTVRVPAEGKTVAIAGSFDSEGNTGAEIQDAETGLIELAPWSFTHLRLVPLPVIPGR